MRLSYGDESYVEATGFLRDVVYAAAPDESETKSCERCGMSLESKRPFGPGSLPLWFEVRDQTNQMLTAHTLDRCAPSEVSP